jgi:hypothetical protein
MACICPEIEENILFFIDILNSAFPTGFDKTPKLSHQL